MSLKSILIVGYFGVSFSLIIWSEVAARTQPESGLLGLGLFGVLTFPSSFIVGLIASAFSSSFGPMSSHVVESRLVEGIILIAGYYQWFYLVPLVFKKTRNLF